jgi:replicative DNA helicase
MAKIDELISLNLEKQVLASLLKYPEVIFTLDHILDSSCFHNSFHSCCFSILREAAQKKEKIDKAILSQRLINIGLKNYQEIDSLSYVDSISYNFLADQDVTVGACHELIKLKRLRGLLEQNAKVEKYILDNKNKELDVIYSNVDKFNNEIIQKYEHQKESPNIFSNIKQVIEERADNPPKNFLLGPFKTINDIYGTLLPPACLNLIGARSGVSKTALSMFYLLHVAEKYNLPILHCDFSEMTMEQLQFRAISAFTNGIVPYHALVRGTWRKNAEWVKLVRQVYPRVEKLKMFYFDVGSMSELQQLSLMRRIYNKEVKGRIGDVTKEQLLLNYDYLKPFDSNNFNSPEWKVMGHFIQDYKSLVNNEIPHIRGWFSLQVNRTGITNNKNSNQVDSSENSFGISDRIQQQSTSSFLVREKTFDEIQDESNRWGNLKMMPLKFREVLGDQWERHFKWIKCIDGKYKKNYLNLGMRSFFFEDKLDCQAIEDFKANQVKLSDHTQLDEVPI